MDARIEQLTKNFNKAWNIDATGRQVQHADLPLKAADYYIGSTLVAKKDTPMYSTASDKSTLVKMFPKGSNIGVIYSYVIKDGFVWWSIDWFSGKHAGFVKHEPGRFNIEIANETASGKKIADTKAAMEKAESETIGAKTEQAAKAVITGTADVVTGVGKTLSALGGNLKWLIIGVLVVAIIGFLIVYKPREN